MFITIQAHQYKAHSNLLEQFFQLRKKTFADSLGWDVPVVGEKEIDCYDAMKPVYLFWCDDLKQKLLGGLRLMPTTGPTLLYDVFRNTIPNAVELRAPGIWEGTRMCLDEGALQAYKPGVNATRGLCLMLLALCECALEHGIHTMISNYEPHMARIYRKSGASVQELGRADGYGRLPVCCGGFEVSTSVLENMRTALGVNEPLYQAFPYRTPVSDMMAEAA